jgi:hypothetical protein
MKRLTINYRFDFIALTIAVSCIWVSCAQMSESVMDESQGINGSFEHAKNGIPYNWLLYTPNTVEKGDFDIFLDTLVFKDGRQSLKFSVRECSPAGGRRSPGLAKEFAAKPGEKYQVSFWYFNQGSEFIAKVRGVSAFKGDYGPVFKSDDTTDAWTEYACEYTIPEKMNALRLDINILQPGDFWIDDIRIVQID